MPAEVVCDIICQSSEKWTTTTWSVICCSPFHLLPTAASIRAAMPRYKTRDGVCLWSSVPAPSGASGESATGQMPRQQSCSQLPISGHQKSHFLCATPMCSTSFDFFEHFACASKCVRSSTCSFTSSLMDTSVISAWVSRMAQSRRAWRRLLMCTQSKRLFDEYFTLQFNTQNAVSAYVVSAIFDHSLITTRTINSCMLQTWAAADSWQSLVSVKAHCSAFQTHCSCGPNTANPSKAALWPCRCRVPTACVFEWGPTRAGDLQTEQWHRKPGQRNDRR